MVAYRDETLPSEAIFAALGDPTRLAILERLRTGEERTIIELAADFAITRQAVTKHLNRLERAGLVTLRRAGRERLVRHEPRGLNPAREWFERHDKFWDERLERLRQAVERKETNR